MTRGREDRQHTFDRFSHHVDGPLMVLALVMGPLLVAPLVLDLSPSSERALLAADYLIWAAFTIEYVVKLYLSPDRWAFVRRNIPDLVIVVVPVLRPLRILRSVRLLRVLRLTRLVAFATEGLDEVRTILRTKGLSYVLLVVLALVFLAAGMALEFEKGVEGANLTTYPEALWWAATTVTTVGYGDRFPMSPAGRGVAVFLMIAGIALFGVITASIAAYFVEQHDDEDTHKLADKLDEVNARLSAIEDRLGMEVSQSPGTSNA